MMTLAWPSRAAYVARIFSSHDFRVEVDILDTEERVKGTARLVDGQINIQNADSGVRRTCSMTLSDPGGALDFSGSSAWSGTSVWANRLLRVRHIVTVGGVEVECRCFVGVPVTMSRSGGEVSVECQDKAALANRGSKVYTVRQGMNAVNAIRNIMRDCAGERHFRLPSRAKRLSRSYSVGWDDSVSPWATAAKIARRELGMQLLYSGDGYLVARKMPSNVSLRVPGVTELASSSVDFTTLVNYVRVFGKTSTAKKSGDKTQVHAVVRVAPAESTSAQSLGRNGVPRYFPETISDDSLVTKAQTKAAGVTEINRHGRLQSSVSFQCVPFFHLDPDDLVAVEVDGRTYRRRLDTASIPLGTGGDMTIGAQAWVSGRPRHKGWSRRTLINPFKQAKKGA